MHVYDISAYMTRKSRKMKVNLKRHPNVTQMGPAIEAMSDAMIKYKK